MRISITDAEGRLAELVRLAEAGDDVVLTRQGEAAVRLVPVAKKPKASKAELKAFLDRMASKSVPANDEAAASQDFLYDEDSLPVAVRPTAAEKRALMESVRASGLRSAAEGPDAAHSQDFLYDANGLPK